MTTVYLAGKMTGLTIQEMTKWRIAATALLSDDFHTYNPAATPLSNRLTDREIVDSNKFQIRNSDVVLVELDHEDVSIGTIGEIVFARENGKPVIAWGSAKKVIEHPWVKEHITIHFPGLIEAVDYIKRNYCKRRPNKVREGGCELVWEKTLFH